MIQVFVSLDYLFDKPSKLYYSMYKVLIFICFALFINACSQEGKKTVTSQNISQKKSNKQKDSSAKKRIVLENEELSKEKANNKEMIRNLELENLHTNLKKVRDKMQKGDSIKVICFGNSITNGYKVGTYSRVSNPYPETLEKIWQEKYGNLNIEVINEGHNGWRIDQALRQLEYLVLTKKPDLVTIMFGINDAYANYSIPKYKQYLRQVVTQLKSKNIKVLLLTPTAINRPENEQVQKYCEVMQQVSQQEEVAFFNIHQTILEKRREENVSLQQLLPDDIHFGDVYYAWIAELIAKEWNK